VGALVGGDLLNVRIWYFSHAIQDDALNILPEAEKILRNLSTSATVNAVHYSPVLAHPASWTNHHAHATVPAGHLDNH